jgi:hypothetical protein
MKACHDSPRRQRLRRPSLRSGPSGDSAGLTWPCEAIGTGNIKAALRAGSLLAFGGNRTGNKRDFQGQRPATAQAERSSKLLSRKAGGGIEHQSAGPQQAVFPL